MKVQSTVQFPIYVVCAELENGLHWAEALFFPELSRLAGKPPVQPLTASLRKRLEQMTSLQLGSRQLPRQPRLECFEVEVPPARRSSIWKEKLLLRFYAVVHRLECGSAGLWGAYLPQLGLEATAEKLELLSDQVKREVRSHLVRTGLLGRILDLIQLQRWQSVRSKILEVEVRNRRQVEGEDSEESQLPKLTTRLEGRGRRAWLVEAELAQLAEMLVEQSVLLVGPSGVGKSALVHELVRRRAEFQLAATPFYETSGSRLIFGEVTFGGWQERCEKLLQELGKLKAILHLGNLQELLESARHSSNPYGVAGFLRPYLAGRRLQVVAEASPEQLAYVEREYPQFLEAFTIMQLEPCDGGRSRQILKGLHPDLPEETREAVVELHERFASLSAAPGWPVRFLDNVLRRRREPGRADVVEFFSRQTGLPLLFLEDSLPFEPSQVRAWFNQRLHGQEPAVERVVDRLSAFKNGLTRPNRPIASFLLLGPTGVGKTELARCLAEFVFQDRARVTRLDMSEYADPWSIRRLIGGEEVGLLVARVRDRPFQVLLFDELEKAHPDFFDLLLQMLGDARLSDDSGRLADFSNCLILMTSNLGAQSFLKGSLGLRERSQQGNFMEAVRAAFRPELLNRIDEIIPFAPLCPETVLRICRDELRRLPGREGLRTRPVEAHLAEGVDRYLAEQGYSKLYGARPLKRALDRMLLAPLSQQLNRHPSHLPLKLDIQLRPGGLSVTATPLATLEKATAVEARQRECNAAISQLRRRYRRFEGGPAITDLRNEKVRHEKRYRSPWPQHAFLQAVSELGPEVENLEELALGALSDPLLFELLPERLQELDSQLTEQMVRAFCLSQDEPHRLVMGLYSEHQDPLHRLLECYLLVAESRGWRVKLERLVLRKSGPPTQPELPISNQLKALAEALPAERPLVWTDQGWNTSPLLERLALEPENYLRRSGPMPALGFVLEIGGKYCAPWFNSEAGWHVQRQRGRDFKVLVETSTRLFHSGDLNNLYAPPAYEPPPDLHRKGALQHPVTVRHYDHDEREVRDGVVGPQRLPGEDWVAVLGPLLEQRLRKRAEAAVLLQ